ncbi:MAG: translation initiation factor eIF-2B [Promethearchaeota archaeon]
MEFKSDKVSGANELVDKALEILKFQLKQITDPNEDIKKPIKDLVREIINSRPSMAPIINAMGFILHDLEIIDKNKLLERIKNFSVDRTARFKALDTNFTDFLSIHCKPHCKIMLISYSSTIVTLLLKNRNYNLEIYILESRPLLEGRKTAEILSQYFKTHLIVDTAMGSFIDEIDLVLIGIDSILYDGSIINKIGTYLLALLASTKNIEIYAVCDSFKYNLKSHYNLRVLISEKPIKEVYNKVIRNKLLEIHNFYFDVTPPKYISGIISDLGVLSISEFLVKVKKILPIEWFKYLIINKEI